MEHINKQMAVEQSEKQQSTQELASYSPNQTDIVKRFGSADTFVSVCNIFMKKVVYKGDEECFFGNYPTLSEINTCYHKNMAKSVVMSQLISLNEFCGCKGKLSEAQCEECAEMIVFNYPHFRISEMALFFAWFKLAHYGQFYGNVDPIIIMSALHTFYKERNDAIYNHDLKLKQAQYEEEIKHSISWEEYSRSKGIEGKKNPLDVLHGV